MKLTRPSFLLGFVAVTAFLLSIAEAEPGLELQRTGTFKTGIFGLSAAEIVAHDPQTQRLFIVNGASRTIDVVSVTDITNPTALFSINMAPFGDVPNSVAVRDGVIAVAMQAVVKTNRGTVVFFDTNGALIRSLTVGALPDMLTFTPDGKKLLVANEGEPSNNYTIDPEGSVSIIDLSRGSRNVTQSDVRTVRFKATPIDPEVRIYGRDASVATDLEPEYITVSPDSKTAWVTLQENNAIGILDIDRARFTAIKSLGFKDHSEATATLELFEFENLPVLGTTGAGEEILLGGFSGLFFEGVNPATGALRFITHTDRGPNGEPVNVDSDPALERPFALPNFQPELVRFEVDRTSGDVSITERKGLLRQDGTALTGLPNLAGTAGLANADEEPVDLFGAPLPLDPFGADLEGVVIAPDGSIWMVDEYRPAIYHFTAEGQLIKRYVPVGSNGSGVNTGVEALPQVYAQRRANRGFEAVAYQNGKIYAFIQSPIDNPDTANDANSRASKRIRILEFNPATETATAEYLYILDYNPAVTPPTGSDKIGDAVSLRTGEFLVIERDDALGTTAAKKVFRINLRGATNLATLAPAIVGPGGTLERMSDADLATNNIRPVKKTVHVDLATVGYNFVDKPEGLAFLDVNTIAVLNDNDFQLEGTFDQSTGKLTPNPEPFPTVLGIISLQSNGLDVSDQDSDINITNWPVFGMYQPDAIASFQSGGQTFLITANEGDARDWGNFVEESRVSALTLDPVAFPNGAATALKRNDALGRLTVTNKSGDTNKDGLFEKLFVLGGRSFSIWNTSIGLVYDSGDQLEQITASALPLQFNSTNDANNSFDNRSDNKGPEPEGVTVGEVDGRTYAFIGLERIGGVMVFELSDPTAPRFVQYVNPRNFSGNAAMGTADDLGPEGILFIPAHQSPTLKPLLVVANEVSGSTSIYEISTTAAEVIVAE